MFKELTSKTKINYSRYHFFHINYLISKGKEKQAESILDALKQDEKIMQKRQILRTKSRKLAKDW